MAEDRGDDRTEPATPRRRQEAREKGNVARSIDLTTSIVLLTAVIALYVFHKDIYSAFRYTFEECFNDAAVSDENSAVLTLLKCGKAVGLALIPFFLVLIVAAVCSSLVQFGFVFSFSPFEFNPDKLNPVTGFQRIFSMRNAVRFLMGLVKLAVISVSLYIVLNGERQGIFNLSHAEFGQVMSYMLWLLFKLSLTVALLLLVIGLIDFAYQKISFERQLMMSRFEVKEEMKKYEGDPKVKERRRQLYRQVVYKRMLQKVPKATVVITNPTEYAIAIKYDIEKDPAPIVVAKGRQLVAQRIREIAAEHNIPIVERKELARALYKICEIDAPVPEALWKACAEVLAYVISMKQRLRLA